MAVVGTADAPLEIFGGLVTDMAAADLPAGVSFDCQDVKFVPGSVQTRPGLLSIFSPIAGTPAVNYLKTYVPQTALLRLLALDAAGSLWKESSNGVLSLVQSGIVANSFGKSTSLFTREYLAIGDGKYGIDIPRQFDDTNFDRVSQVGPGVAPGAADENVVQNLSNSPNGAIAQTGAIVASPTGATESGFVVTIKLSLIGTALIYCKVGDPVQITGVGVAGYNGTFNITAILDSQTFQYVNSTSGLAGSGGGTVNFPIVAYAFASISTVAYVDGQLVNIAGVGVGGYNTNGQAIRAGTVTPGGYPVGAAGVQAFLGSAAFGLAASGGGTLTNAGSISAGLHQISVVFKTRQGYFTAPAPPNSWTAGGGKRVTVSGIPTGPPNIIARVLIFTLVGQSFFFYTSGITGLATSNFVINDNTTTSVTVDFTDLGLSGQPSADYFFKLRELGECSGVIDYSSRLFWWGERAKLGDNKEGNTLNLTFDGGSKADSQNGIVPLGWGAAQSVYFFTSGGGGIDYVNSVWGGAYTITGDGATAQRGAIYQGVVKDSNGVAIIQPGVSYSVRVKVKANSTLAQGTLNIILRTLQGFQSGIAITAAQLTTSFQEFSGILTSGTSPIPNDYALVVYASGTPTNGGTFYIDNIEIYPTNQPNNTSLVRASRIEDPESYDGVTGFLNVAENDGFAVRSAFVIRENLYFVKEHGIYVTQDDGTNEPSLWKITEVSRKVGTPSVNGVAVGQDWAVIAHRTGAWFFAGGEPKKISQEIQPTWDRINWNAGQSLWVQIDLQNKRIYFGVPLDTATKPNVILMMDYRGIDPPDEIPTATPVHTSYSGKLLVLEKSRKWSIWNITANSGAIVERFDGTQKMFFGNGAGTGKIYQLTDSQFTDDGVTIAGYYNTYFHFTHDLEQVFQLGSHNKLYTYLRAFAEGSGTFSISAVHPGNAPLEQIAAIPLTNPALRDIELPINVTAARAAFKITTANNGDWFRLARFIVNAIKHPSAPVRGWN